MVEIKLSNRVMYSLVTFGIIVLLAIGVYAVAPNPGHTAIEIEFTAGSIPVTAVNAILCQADGTNCPEPEVSGLYVDSTGGQLCWPTETPNECFIQSTACERAGIGEVMYDPDCESLSLTTRNSECDSHCKTKIACDGDATQFSCDAYSTKNFTSGYFDACGAIGDEYMYCLCDAAGETYLKEYPYNPTGESCAVIA